MNRMTTKALAVTAALALTVVSTAVAEAPRKCTGELQECIKYLAAKLKASGWVGVEVQRDEKSGAYRVVNVIEDSPAETAGIKKGDILLSINGKPLCDIKEESLEKARFKWKPGQSITYTIERDGSDREISLTLAPMPAQILAKYIGEHVMLHAVAEHRSE